MKRESIDRESAERRGGNMVKKERRESVRRGDKEERSVGRGSEE